MCHQAYNPAQERATRSPCILLISRYRLFSWTITLSPQSVRLMSRFFSFLSAEGLREANNSPKNHAILHSFLSRIIEEFLVRNSFVKPPPQIQPRDESVQNPRKRRRLADHSVSIYSPGPSQQPYHAAGLDYFPSEQELLQPGCSECSGSCDGCSSCCDECLHSHEGSDPGYPGNVYHDDGQQALEEQSLSDEFFYARVSSNLNPPRAC